MQPNNIAAVRVFLRRLSNLEGGVHIHITLVRAAMEDAPALWQMQRIAFAGLLETYQDYDTNPGNETLEKVQWRLSLPDTYFYLIRVDGVNAGAIRVVDTHDGSPKRISPLFVLPAFRGKGVAQSAIREVERIHGSLGWTLGTILQEQGNCHLYEKMGYHRTGSTKRINDRMTLVFYEK